MRKNREEFPHRTVNHSLTQVVAAAGCSGDGVVEIFEIFRFDFFFVFFYFIYFKFYLFIYYTDKKSREVHIIRLVFFSSSRYTYFSC